MRTMTIGKRIFLTSLTFVSLTVVLTGIGWHNAKRITQNIRPITAEIIPGLMAINPIDAGSEGLQRIAVEYMYATPAEMAAYESQVTERVNEILQGKQQLEKSAVTERGRQLVARLSPAIDRFLGLMDKCFTLCRANRKEEAAALYKAEGRPSMEALDKVLGDFGDLLTSEAQNATDIATSAANSANSGAWLMLVISIAGGGAVTVFTTRGITRALGRMMSELTGAAEKVAGAASQVAKSSQSLAQGSSEQAASLEETSASSEQINAMVRRNSENSREVAGLVTGSQRKFVQANQSLEETVTSMGEIHTHSGKISRIIKVIDEIAFQTNILALNAAVEAARAGEAGMSFAVVAGEVRNLSQRCAQAARDTAELIEESISKSIDGKAKVDQVATAIHLIIDEFGKVKTLVDEVHQGSQQQTRGIDEVSKAVLQMQTVTQSTAAEAEESAAAAEELSAQSEALTDVVRRLTVLVDGGESRLRSSR